MGIKPEKLMLRQHSIRTLTALEMGAARGGDAGVTTEPGSRDGKHPRTR